MRTGHIGIIAVLAALAAPVAAQRAHQTIPVTLGNVVNAPQSGRLIVFAKKVDPTAKAPDEVDTSAFKPTDTAIAARETNVPAGLLDVIIRYSSGYRPGVISDDGRYGLLQLEPHHLRSLGIEFGDLLDPRENIRAGSRYLYICEDGLVHYCSQQRGFPGVPIAEYTTEDVKREYLTAKSCSPNCTIGCVHKISYIDHWRSPQTRTISPGEPQTSEPQLVNIQTGD